MRVFTCKDFTGHWSVGTSAVVVAKDEDEARLILIDALDDAGLTQLDRLEVYELETGTPNCRILQDGNY